jgi:hypothetical protein
MRRVSAGCDAPPLRCSEPVRAQPPCTWPGRPRCPPSARDCHASGAVASQLHGLHRPDYARCRCGRIKHVHTPQLRQQRRKYAFATAPAPRIQAPRGDRCGTGLEMGASCPGRSSNAPGRQRAPAHPHHLRQRARREKRKIAGLSYRPLLVAAPRTRRAGRRRVWRQHLQCTPCSLRLRRARTASLACGTELEIAFVQKYVHVCGAESRASGREGVGAGGVARVSGGRRRGILRQRRQHVRQALALTGHRERPRCVRRAPFSRGSVRLAHSD